MNDKIKEDEGYKAILCKLDKDYAAKEKEKAKKLQEEQVAKKKAIDKKNREQKIKNTNKNMQNVAGVFAITIFAGLGISIGVYKGRKIIRKMKEDRAAKKEALERFIRTCK